MQRLETIFWLGTKELRSLQHDLVLVIFVVYSFTLAVYTQANGTSSEVHNASIALVDEDRSALSNQLFNAFQAPQFFRPVLIEASEIDRAMDQGKFIFILEIPPRFEADARSGRVPKIQVNIDATAMTQAGIGASYISNIVLNETRTFLQRTDNGPAPAMVAVTRRAFNPNGVTAWFTGVVAIINQVTLLTVVLTGAALLREREQGTIEHLLVMPLTAFDIALAKVWSNGLVILVACTGSLFFILRTLIGVPVAGSPVLFLGGVVLYLFFATALGIFLATIARTMAQFALLVIVTAIVLQLLSGGNTPVESQPEWLQRITWFLPSRCFVSFSQAIIYRGAGLSVVWPDFALVVAMGSACFIYSLRRFRLAIAASK